MKIHSYQAASPVEALATQELHNIGCHHLSVATHTDSLLTCATLSKLYADSCKNYTNACHRNSALFSIVEGVFYHLSELVQYGTTYESLRETLREAAE
jgi:hypothetical protein